MGHYKADRDKVATAQRFLISHLAVDLCDTDSVQNGERQEFCNER